MGDPQPQGAQPEETPISANKGATKTAPTVYARESRRNLFIILGLIAAGLSLCVGIGGFVFGDRISKVIAGTPIAAPPNPLAPVIANVELNEDTSSGSLVVYQRISFTDLDGDAYYVHYELVNTTTGLIHLNDSDFSIPIDQQRLGAFVTGTWDCGEGIYTVTLQASIWDRAGNQSNAWEYTINCR